MSGLRFEKPSAAMRAEIEAFAQSFYDAGERTINGSGGLDFFDGFEAWLDNAQKVEDGVIEGLVPSRIWLARDDTGHIVGILDIRPTLPPEKEKFGHIGYAVAPPCRRRGHAGHMVRWGLEKLREAGLEKAVACCHEDNLPSRRTLERNGFVLTGHHPEEDTNKKVLVYQNKL